MIMEMVTIVEEITVPRMGVTMEAFTTEQFYLRTSLKEMETERIEYQLEQEEIARLEREKEEAEQRRLEEERLRQEAEQQRQAKLLPHFNPYNVAEPSNVDSEGFYTLLGNTGLNDVAWTFAYAEEHYGINGLFLAGLVALESGWGNSVHARINFNLTGYNIKSDSDVYRFESRADSVLATAKLLATHYLPADGKYHHGTSVWAINKNYCANEDWGDKIVSIANKFLKDS